MIKQESAAARAVRPSGDRRRHGRRGGAGRRAAGLAVRLWIMEEAVVGGREEHPGRPPGRGRPRGLRPAAARRGDGAEGPERAALPDAERDHGRQEEGDQGREGCRPPASSARSSPRSIVGLEALPPRPPGRIIHGDPKAWRESSSAPCAKTSSDLGTGDTMPDAFWCIVEDDRNGSPKKVMAEVIGEAAPLAPSAGSRRCGSPTRRATGLKQLGEWGAGKVLLLENAAFAPYRSEVWTAAAADLATKESPAAIFAPVTSRQREFEARLAARLGVGLAADSVRFATGGRQARRDPSGLRGQAALEGHVGEGAVGGDPATQRVPARGEPSRARPRRSSGRASPRRRGR